LSALKSQLVAVAAAAAGAFAFKRLVGGAVSAAAKVETLSTQFSTLLGSTKAAESQMQSLVDFAASTPFKLEGLAEASQLLLSFGFSLFL